MSPHNSGRMLKVIYTICSDEITRLLQSHCSTLALPWESTAMFGWSGTLKRKAPRSNKGPAQSGTLSSLFLTPSSPACLALTFITLTSPPLFVRATTEAAACRLRSRRAFCGLCPTDPDRRASAGSRRLRRPRRSRRARWSSRGSVRLHSR